KLGSSAARLDGKHLLAALVAAFLSAGAAPTMSQAQPSGGTATPAPASAQVVINLIRLLVQEGVLTQAKADALIREAEDEAEVAARNRPPTLSEATRGMDSL